VRHRHRGRAAGRSDRCQRGAHVGGGQFPQPLAPDDRQDRQEHVPVLAHRRSRPAVQAVGQPVPGRFADGHRLRVAEARLDVGVQTPELVPHLGRGLAAHLAADSPAVRAVPGRDDAAPAVGAPPVLVRDAAGRRVVVVDGALAPATACRHGPERPARKPNGSRLVSSVSLVLSNCGLDLVRGTRFELVTSSVSGYRCEGLGSDLDLVTWPSAGETLLTVLHLPVLPWAP
jgi:hypothetical protein